MSEQKLPSNCPHCGAEMMDDAWERIDIKLDGKIVVEPISPAWVCSDFCGILYV